MGLPNLAIVAGSGSLPQQLAEHCQSNGRGYHVIHFEGIELDWVAGHPVIPARFEKPGKMFKALQYLNCTQVVFAGGMKRPKLNPLKFDLKLMKLAPTLLPSLKNGDDSALRMIAQIFENEGLEIIAAHEIIEELFVTTGTNTSIKPNDADLSDIKRGLEILDSISSADIGQACIVAQGLCLGVETIQGSDALLTFVSTTKQRFLDSKIDGRGVIIKAPKRGQDQRLDMPTIGPNTVQMVYDAGLAGIALTANGVQVLDHQDCIKLANSLGIFITVVENNE